MATQTNTGQTMASWSAKSNSSAHEHEALGQEFTEQVINSFGPRTDPRLREVMSSLVQHLHDFARDVELTFDEWLAAVKLINQAGQMSNDIRNEGQLLCDIIGLER